MRRITISAILILTVTLVALATFAIGYRAGSPMYVMPPTAALSAERPLLISSFRQLHNVTGAVAYYETNRERVCAELREAHEMRCRALFAMYVTHTTTPYGETTQSFTVAGLLAGEFAHCGTYAGAQHQLNVALGLVDRQFDLDTNSHRITEVVIDDAWETFDATTNVWISTGVRELARGDPRTYRLFYTPLTDPNRPDAREHLALGYDALALRALQVFWGLGVPAPTRVELVEDVNSGEP